MIRAFKKLLKSIKDNWCDNDEKYATNFPAFFCLIFLICVMF